MGTRRVLAEERDILSHDSVDWIILLHTEEGRGTLLEIGYFSNYPEIIKKTTLFFPKDFYNPDENLAANTVEGFWSPPVPHTQEHLASCSVVAECKDMAAVRLQCEATLHFSGLGHPTALSDFRLAGCPSPLAGHQRTCESGTELLVLSRTRTTHHSPLSSPHQPRIPYRGHTSAWGGVG